MPVFETASAEETIALGERIARALPHSAVVLLIGDLGAGKTTLAKGVAQGLGAAPAEEVSSPTFTLIHEYGGGRVYHIDLYRIEEEQGARRLGIEEILERNAVVLVEWGERFPRLWPEDAVEIRMEAQGDRRRIAIERLAV